MNVTDCVEIATSLRRAEEGVVVTTAAAAAAATTTAAVVDFESVIGPRRRWREALSSGP